MTQHEQQPPTALLPAAIAAVLAVVGVAGMIFVFASAQQISDGGVGITSANAAYRAGATITPTTPGFTRLSRPIPSSSTVAAGDMRKDL